MKKTFKQLTAGDIVYEVESGSTKILNHEIYKVEGEYANVSYNKAHKRIDETSYRKQNDYQRFVWYFTHQPDAIRFAKAQLMKELFSRIESAKKQIKYVQQFKNEHFELLNHEWTERQINILEKEISQQ